MARRTTSSQWEGSGAGLTGLRIVECGHGVAAAYAAKLIADLGAEVIKVEEPRGDRARFQGPFPEEKPHPEKSALFLYLNSNKKGITLNLRHHKGQQLLRMLVGQADALIHNYAPDETGRLGIDYVRLSEANNRLVMTSISAFGHDGPYRDYRAEDLTVACAGGWAWINGWPGRPEMPPLKAYGQQTEYQAGLTAAMATMAALLHRRRSGVGQHIDISAQACTASMLEIAFTYWTYQATPVVRWGYRPVQPQDFFRCKDGWIFVLCVEKEQWQQLVSLLGNPEWADSEVFSDPIACARNYDALRPLLEESFQDWTVEELYRAAQARRIPVAPASTVADLSGSEHLAARDFFVTISHPEAGPLTYPGAPYKPHRMPWRIESPAPTLGQHNDGVYLGLLGLSNEDYQTLRAEEVL